VNGCRYVSRNKVVNRNVADLVVQRFIAEGAAATAAELVTKKVLYGLFPSSAVYLDLMKAVSEAGLSVETVAVFERLILEGSPSESESAPPLECFDMLSRAAEAGGVAPSRESASSTAVSERWDVALPSSTATGFRLWFDQASGDCIHVGRC
jgi:hypothetical protein